MAKAPAKQPEKETRTYQDGFQDGLHKGYQEILQWLENAYINDPGRPDRGSPKAEAILEVARAASEHFVPKTVLKQMKKGRRQ